MSNADLAPTPLRRAVDGVQYALAEIADKGDDPHWWHQRFTSRVVGPVINATRGREGVDFMARDWDNLLILDACRADLFEQTVDTNAFDEYESVHSLGTSSPHWMRETFGDRTFPDTVYVTANPWIAKTAPETFAHVENLWVDDLGFDRAEFQGACGHDAVGNDGETIHPDTLSEAARRIHDEYPNKRVIVHYFQPHAPIAGHPDGTPRDELDHERDPGDRLRRGVTSREAVWEGYQDNLLYALHHARQLAQDLGGRSVFTADHGELLGEWLWPFPFRGYAHPGEIRHPKLTEVPWAVVEHGDRREITAGDVEHHDADEAEINDHLRDLGYLE